MGRSCFAEKQRRISDLVWTFPDLRDGRYNNFFLQVRAEFKTEISLS